ncbi:MAG: D-tyrosyl-tRNA(Tyr) deacylase [Proteobacteria bacterium]|nr:D-tyrosyl-tRNA(Tyr) deacylase [Pseudomonadota bacterium]
MRAVFQRVLESSVTVDGAVVGRIGRGAMVLLGVGEGDSDEDVRYLADKVANLRVFTDPEGKMNLSVREIGGEVLVVSQFTLYGDCRKGRRPSFASAAAPEEARRLYVAFCERLRGEGLTVAEGIFQADMTVHIVNQGPVTIMLDSRRGF